MCVQMIIETKKSKNTDVSVSALHVESLPITAHVCHFRTYNRANEDKQLSLTLMWPESGSVLGWGK